MRRQFAGALGRRQGLSASETSGSEQRFDTYSEIAAASRRGC